MRNLTAVVMLAFGFISSACGAPPPDAPPDAPPVEPAPPWTVLVYLAADNNLEAPALLDLEELAAAGASDDVRILVQIDRVAGFTDEPALGLGDFTTAKRVEIRADHTITEIEDLGEIDMGDPAALEDFVAWGLTHAPSEHVLIDLWDHGGGWTGFGVDDTGLRSGVLSLEDTRDAIAAGMARAEPARERVDIIAFDACFMAGLETLRAFAPLTDRILASEELVPLHGLDYAVLAALVADPTLVHDDVARILIDGFVAQAEASGRGPVITMSNLDTTALAPLDEALTALAEAIAQSNGDDAAMSLARARFAAVEFGAAPDPAEAVHFVDLDGWAGSLSLEGDFYEPAIAVRRALNDVVVDNVAGTQLEGAAGVSVYLPSQTNLVADAYAELAFMDDWHKLIDDTLVRATSIPPSFAAGSVELTQASGAEVSVMVARLTDESMAVVVGARVEAGELGPDGLPLLFVRGPGVIEGEVVSAPVVPRQSGVLIDGGGLAHAVFLDFDDSGARRVPFEYEDEAGNLLGYVELVQTFDDAGVITSETWSQRDGAVASELVPVPGGTLYPMVLQVAPNGLRRWIRLANVDGIAGAADGIPATFAYTLGVGELDGPLYIALTATGAGGRGDTVVYSE